MTEHLIAADFFGTIQPPAAIAAYGPNGGLITFGNNLLILAVIIGGVLTLFNVVQAGYIYLTAGTDTKAHEKVLNKITMSLWGMAIMILAPALMALFGFLFFKNPSFFLKPTISGPSTEGTGSKK
ncbi:MAG TPA: hypothetical protein VFG51_03395 [Candidatus Saccharimonadia bacterium]|nr:hypothetical protein [Candidatus Saccharimonadia bacterium]